MKTFSVAAPLIAAAVSMPVFAASDNVTLAQTIAVDRPTSKTRAQVNAELAVACEPGGEFSLNPNHPLYPAQFAFGGYTVPIVQIDTHPAGSARMPSRRN